MIKVRRYTVDFELRTEADDPDELFKAYAEELGELCNSLERIKVISVQPKPHRRINND